MEPEEAGEEEEEQQQHVAAVVAVVDAVDEEVQEREGEDVDFWDEVDAPIGTPIACSRYADAGCWAGGSPLLTLPSGPTAMSVALSCG